jgi:hypothetical protein
MPSPSQPSRVLVVASTFYTAALEQPFIQALARRGDSRSVLCVPYNQLHTFLLNPVVPDNTLVNTVLLLRVEDLIRFELAELGDRAHESNVGLNLFRQHTEQLLDVLNRISRLQLMFMMCPSGHGACDLSFLGNATRIAEHKVLATLRSQQRHTVFTWDDFEGSANPKNCFNVAGDRLGHVPFTPEGLDALAEFFVAQLDRAPAQQLTPSGGSGTLDLQQFLASLAVAMAAAPLTAADERTVIDVVRHTTHFINVPGRKWEGGGIGEWVAAMPFGEAWVFRVQDRFGDYGTSGAVAFDVQDGAMHVDLLFLSCAVLGKQTEFALFHWLAQQAELRQVETIEIPFIPGRDNQGLGNLLTRLAGEGSASNAPASQAKGEKRFRLAVAGLAERAMRGAPHPAALSTIVSKMPLAKGA